METWLSRSMTLERTRGLVIRPRKMTQRFDAAGRPISEMPASEELHAREP